MLRILHLEDSQEDNFLLRRNLHDHGIPAELYQVSNLSAYVAAVEKANFDLILSDGGVPGLSGVEAIKIARQQCPATPFICWSGGRDEQQILASLEAGAADYVLKDHPWQVVAAIWRALKIKEQELEKARLEKINQAQKRLVEAVQELSLARDLNTIMAIVRRAARELTGADGSTFVLRDRDLCHYADEDAIAPLWKGQRFPMTACVSGWSMIHREPVVIPDIYADARVPAEAYRPTFVRSLAMVPIRASSPIGAIGNYWAVRRQPTVEEVELLQALANTTAVAMENVQVYEELEQRVRDRTAQLEAANRELEAFSYAVSHDLSAPLRHISGFADIVLTDNAEKLDDFSRQCLTKIQAGTRDMAGLINDLLRLSRVIRSDLDTQRVNLSGMAREIASRLVTTAPERQVDWDIQGGIEVYGDPGLLRIVLENILGNAWKYTAKQAHTRIEMGVRAEPDEGKPVYYLRDNGAGFNMNAAGQLFQPFRRLHTQKEFPGSGVGLATVQRIIRRHGGRVWAEAAVNQGATFFFTLGM